MRSDHISIKRQRSAAGGGEERAQALTERGEGPKTAAFIGDLTSSRDCPAGVSPALPCLQPP